jgi:hypothetical protein
MAAFALAAPAVAADKDKKSSEDAPKQKKICRTETVTGSLIAKRRICMTKAEWDQFEAATKKALDEFQGSAAGAPKCISPQDVACTGSVGVQ